MNDITKEKVLLVSALPRHPLFRREPPQPQVNPSTIQRWIHRGIIGPRGNRVKLEAIRLGGRWYTSIEAVERFSALLSGTTVKSKEREMKAASAAEVANDALKELGY